MPSQQVIDKLVKLQTELETVSEAIKHIDEASKVAKSAADILKNISGLLVELKSIEETHRKNLQKDFKEKIDSIEKQLQSIEETHRKNLQKDFKEKIDSIEKQLQSMMFDLKDKTNLLSQLIEDTKKLEESITDYFAELRKINFPERLDKIDNQISSINIGVGNLQTFIQHTQKKVEKGFDETTHNLSNGFSSSKDYIKHSQEIVTSDLATHTNEKTAEIIKHLSEQNQLLKNEVTTNRIIQIFGLVIVLGILFIILTKL